MLNCPEVSGYKKAACIELEHIAWAGDLHWLDKAEKNTQP